MRVTPCLDRLAAYAVNGPYKHKTHANVLATGQRHSALREERPQADTAPQQAAHASKVRGKGKDLHMSRNYSTYHGELLKELCGPIILRPVTLWSTCYRFE